MGSLPVDDQSGMDNRMWGGRGAAVVSVIMVIIGALSSIILLVRIAAVALVPHLTNADVLDNSYDGASVWRCLRTVRTRSLFLDVAYCGAG
jgi:hypothetical protein